MRAFRKMIGLAFAGLLVLTSPAGAEPRDADELVIQAEYTIQRMWDHPEFSKYVRQYLRRAKAVVIVPDMFEGGFIIGGAGGTGLLLARGGADRWSYPAFLSTVSASAGLQIGGHASQMLLIIMTGRGLQAILNDRVQIGGALTGAVGPYGSGAEASITTNLDVDVISYSISSGLFVGVSIEGTVLIPRESLIRDYYGRAVTPREVVIEGAVGNPQADSLRETLRKLVSQ